ncbi:MAG: O-antigen ligase domain-containing protein [Nevskiaceae bacterium]|nr:MAG: O-antigen ligase domain-containing protein [Nevskiaceae bacterium]TAM30740.1 MAG: O-antigen ligase domain-containing protein [Nevskiaceae bacterium]
MSLFSVAPSRRELLTNPHFLGLAGLAWFCLIAYLYPLSNWVGLLPLFPLAILSPRSTASVVVMCWLPSSLGGALHPWLGNRLPIPPDDLTQTLRWLLVSWCLLVAIMRKRQNGEDDYSYITLIAVYVALLLVLSILTSEFPRTSFSRVMAWAIAVSAIHVCLQKLSAEDWNWVVKLFITTILSTTLVSLAVQGLPGARMGFNALLRGIFAHPQNLGPMIASLCAYLVCHYLLRQEAKGGLHYTRAAGILLACLLALYWTRSRTAALSFVLGIALAVVVHRTVSDALRFHGGKLVATTILCLIAGTAFVIADPNVLDSIVNKYNAEESALDLSMQTRLGMYGRQIGVFLNYPLFGSGFGLPALAPEDYENARKTGTLYFSTEKGFLLTAVLQEGGLVGFALFVGFLLAMLKRMGRNSDPRILAAAGASLFSNIGEASFFALGGIGYYHWIWFTLAMQSATRGRKPLTSGIPPPSPTSVVQAANPQ